MSIDQKLVESDLGYSFNDPQWMQQAFCHKSFQKENPDWKHNEILEFLGDAVLDLVVSDILIETFSEDKEGSLSRKRASIVNEDRLCELAQSCKMDKHLLIGEREVNNQLRSNSRIIASVFEAVVGAIYKDSGFDVVDRWIRGHFQPLVEGAFKEHDFEKDYKTRFQEWVQEQYKQTPRYQVIEQKGPDHDRTFVMEVFVDGQSWGTAEGNSKKNAAQNAAKQALDKVPK